MEEAKKESDKVDEMVDFKIKINDSIEKYIPVKNIM